MRECVGILEKKSMQNTGRESEEQATGSEAEVLRAKVKHLEEEGERLKLHTNHYMEYVKVLEAVREVAEEVYHEGATYKRMVKLKAALAACQEGK